MDIVIVAGVLGATRRHEVIIKTRLMHKLLLLFLLLPVAVALHAHLLEALRWSMRIDILGPARCPR